MSDITQQLDRLLSALSAVKRTGDSKWMSKCPAHDDRAASLSVTIGNNGGILLHCFANCATADIIGAIGLTFADLFPTPPPKPKYQWKNAGDRQEIIHYSGEPIERERLPRQSRYDLFPLVCREATILYLAIHDLLAGKQLSERNLARVERAMATISNIRDETR